MLVVLLISGVACQNTIDGPSMNCPGMSFQLNLNNLPYALNLSSSTFFRQKTDSGGRKYLSIEAVNDSVKIIINVNDGMYSDSLIQNDSITYKTYSYSKSSKVQGGLVIVGIQVPGDYGYKYLDTDTSSVTITKINPQTKKVYGYYYVSSSGHTVLGSGSFESTCYLSLR
ncbi:hypothetical protein F3J22_02215 [Chitinophaga sp. Cy-1792]|nr:hypothetical protein [Chitinophaga sp. Cy-1792]